MSDMTQVIADVIARSIYASQAPLLARIAALESKEVHGAVNGRDGRDIDPIVVKALVVEAVDAAVKSMPAPKDGAAGTRGENGEKGDAGEPGNVGATGLKGEPGATGDQGEAGEPGATGPKGEPGETGDVGPVGATGAAGGKGETGDVGPVGATGAIGPVGPTGEKGAQGVAGKDADPLQLKSLQDEVTRLREEVIVLKSIPAPKDGKDGTPGTKGDTGHSVTAALVDKSGSLVLTFSDGTVKEVGVVVGKDGTNGTDGVGLNGKDAAPVDMVAVKSMVTEAVDAIPRPKDGTNGADGLGFDDLEFIPRGVRGVTLKFTRGDRVKSFDWDATIPIYQGTFEVGKSYETGDMVTRQGSVWFCKAPTSEMPGDGAKTWQLCVKRGSPGQKGDQGPVGATGKPGVNLTQMDNAGGKW